jgi:phytoene synthase
VSSSIEAAYRHCEEVVGSQAQNFKYAFLFLPGGKRRGISALYAFCRLCDDAADEAGSTEEKRGRLGEIRNRLTACARGSFDGPVWEALGDTIARFSVPVRLFEHILEGVEQDLTVRRYEVFGQLREYCFRVASAVGLTVLEVLGYSDRAALSYGIDLGLAMQLTNILRDVPEDADRDRIYLPLEDLRRFGVGEELLIRGRRATPEFRELMRFEAARARRYFESARPLKEYLARTSRSCPMVLSAVYEKLLDRIEDSGYDVFSSRPRVPTAGKVWILLTTLGRSLL